MSARQAPSHNNEAESSANGESRCHRPREMLETAAVPPSSEALGQVTTTGSTRLESKQQDGAYPSGSAPRVPSDEPAARPVLPSPDSDETCGPEDRVVDISPRSRAPNQEPDGIYDKDAGFLDKEPGVDVNRTVLWLLFLGAAGGASTFIAIVAITPLVRLLLRLAEEDWAGYPLYMSILSIIPVESVEIISGMWTALCLALLAGFVPFAVGRNAIARWLSPFVSLSFLALYIWLFQLLYKDGTDEWFNMCSPQRNHTSPSALRQWVSIRGCESRVEPQQSNLFNATIYYGKPESLESWTRELEGWEAARNNQTLCYQGFEGNTDLYGLGIRLGIYFQWAGSILSNTFIPEIAKELQKTHLIFSVALCVVTFVLSLISVCTFGIEIEVLSWLYWGGDLCVFTSLPNRERLEGGFFSFSIDWRLAIRWFAHTLMIYHYTWFKFFGHNWVFPKMPCGTYHFFLIPLLDPSSAWCFIQNLVLEIISPFAITLILAIPFATIILVSEIKGAIRSSIIWRTLFPRSSTLSVSQQESENDLEMSHATTSNDDRARISLRGTIGKIREAYHAMRDAVGLPAKTEGAIRLIGTPLDKIQRTNYRIGCALLGVISFGVSVAAAEATLKWNKITHIYDMMSTGQIVPFIVGFGALVGVIFKLVQQELRRREDRKRRQRIGEEIELDSLPPTVAGALRFAFSQPDVEYFSNDGVLPTHGPVTSETQGAHNEQSESENRPVEPLDDYMMSGGLDSDEG